MFKSDSFISGFRFISNPLAMFITVLFAACFLFSAAGQMQTADKQISDNSANDLSVPQAGRPDIRWMRGGNVFISAYGQPYFFADGQSFMTASEGEIKYWRTSDGVLLKSFKAVTAGLDISDYALSPNKQTIAVVGAGSNSLPALRFFNATDGSFLREISLTAAPNYVVFSPDSQNVASDSGGNGIIQLWRVSDGALLHTYQTATGQSSINFPTITSLPAFSPDGQYISGTEQFGAALVIVRVSDGLVFKNYNINSTGAANNRGTIFSPSSQYVISSQRNGAEVAVWRLSDPCTSGSCNPLVILTSNTVTDKNLVFSPDGTKLAMGGRINTGQSVNLLWNTAGWATGQTGFIRSYNSNSVTDNAAVAFTPDGTGLLSQSYNMKLWSVADGSLIRNLDGHSSVLTAVAYSPNGQIIATTTNTYAVGVGDPLPGVYLWRASDGALLRTIDYGAGIQSVAGSVAFSPDGQTIAVGGGIDASTRKTKIFNVATGALISTIDGIGSVSVVFSPDGLTIATGDGGSSFSIHRVSDGGLVRNFTNSSPSPSFSPDGQRITDGKNIYRISDGATLFTLNSINNPSYPNGAAYSPNGQLIAAVSNNNGVGGTYVVRLYNAATGAFLRELAGHSNTITTVAFSADSSTLFSGGNDATIRFWRVSDGTPLQTYDQETGTVAGTQIIGGAFSPDGQFFTYGRATDATVVMARNSFYTPPTYSISGQITNGANGLGGVSVALSGTSSATITTDASGNYTFGGLAASGNYTVTPILANYTFAPPNRAFANLSANQTGANFAAALNCSFSINPSGQNFTSAGGNGSSNVIAPVGCAWTSTSNASWITITSGASGSGNGNVAFSIAGNSGAARTGTLTIAGQTFTVTQDALVCNYLLSPASPQSFTSAGGSGTIGVNVNFGCAWSAMSNSTWISINNGASGNGNGSVSFSVSNNTGTARTGTMIIAGQLFTINQDAANRRTIFDFDGDGKADISVFRPDNGVWYLLQSTNGFTGLPFGFSTDKITPADFDGDGKTDVAVYRSGTWYLQRSSLGFTGVAFGAADDIPVPADYDGDGKADVAVFRPSNGVWYIQQSTLGFISVAFGQNGDKPVPADYDGDGKADIAVFRAGTWYIQRSNLGFTGIAFGSAADKPVPADYDGDGKADVAVFRDGVWYLLRSQLGFTGLSFGQAGDLPVAADYDGDGKADVAVFRSGVWYLLQSTAGFTGVTFGAATDKPIPNAFVF